MLFEIVGFSFFLFCMYMTEYGLWQALFWQLFVLSLQLLLAFLGITASAFGILYLSGASRIDDLCNLYYYGRINNESKLERKIESKIEDKIEKSIPELELVKQNYNKLVIECELLRRQMSERYKVDTMNLNQKLDKALVDIGKHESTIRERDIAAQKAAEKIESCKLDIEAKDAKIADLNKQHEIARELAEEVKSCKLSIKQKDVKIADLSKQCENALTIQDPQCIEDLPEDLKKTLDEKHNEHLLQQKDELVKASNNQIKQLKEDHEKSLKERDTKAKLAIEATSKKNDAKVQSLEKVIAKLSASVKEFEAANTHLDSDAQKEEKRFEDLTKDYEKHLKAREDEAKMAIEELDKKHNAIVEDLVKKIATLSASVEELESTKTNLAYDAQNKGKHLEDLAKNYEEQLKIRENEARAYVDNLSKTYDAKVQGLEAEVANLSASVKELDSTKAQLELHAKEETRLKEGLIKKHKKLIKEYDSMDDRFAECLGNLLVQANKIQDLENCLKEAENKYDQTEKGRLLCVDVLKEIETFLLDSGAEQDEDFDHVRALMDVLDESEGKREEYLREMLRLKNDLRAARTVASNLTKEKNPDDDDGLASKNLELEMSLCLVEEERDQLLAKVEEMKRSQRPIAVPKSRKRA